MVKNGELTVRQLEDCLQSVVTTRKKQHALIIVSEKYVKSSVELWGKSGNVIFDKEYSRATVYKKI